MAQLVVVLLVTLAVGTFVAAYASYRRHTRAAQARSRAALNRLLAEADELQQCRAAEQVDDSGGQDSIPT